MFKMLGRLATRYPWTLCAFWLVTAVCVAWIAPKWESTAQDDDIRFMPARTDSVRGYRLLEKSFPKDVYASRIIFTFERPDRKLDDQDFRLIDDLVAELDALRQAEPDLKLGKILSYRDPYIGKRLVSEDRQCTLIQVGLGSPYLALKTQVAVDRAEAQVRKKYEQFQGASAPILHVTGPAGLGRDLTSASLNSLDNTTIATIILVIVILLFVYRSPLLALIPLLTIAICTFVALNILSICTWIPGFHLVSVSRIFAIVMLYGAGTDYCLFLVSRYREELAEGREEDSALIRSLTKVGGALAASAGTVICGLGLMGLAEHAKIRSAGPAIALGLTIALLGSLTLAPALLKLLGRFVFWPCGMPQRKTELEKSRCLWTRLSHGVVKRPAIIWAVAVLVLLPLAWLGLQVKPSYRATAELSKESTSVQGLETIKRHFTAGETGPVTVLLASKTDWKSDEGRYLIRHLSEGFLRLDNVADVRSLTQPLGEKHSKALHLDAPKPPPAPVQKKKKKSAFDLGINRFLTKAKTSLSGVIAKRANEQAEEHYVTEITENHQKQSVTRLDVVLKSDPFDPESVVTLNVLQSWLRNDLPKTAGDTIQDLRTETYGVTVSARDLAEVTESDRQRINVLVLLGILLILIVLVRKLWLAGYLLLTVLFSYYATLGATTIMATWLHDRPFGEVDWRVPFFLFTILVAVGEDYNILLMTRAVKEKKRRGSIEGMRVALARTGGTITSCGLIMAGTFATLMLAGLGTLMQIGFALALGVLLDTFLVRPFLVPAFTTMVWRQKEPQPAPPAKKKSVPLPERKPPSRMAA